MNVIELEKIKTEMKPMLVLITLNGFIQTYKPYTIFAYIFNLSLCSIIAYSAYYFNNETLKMFESIYNLSITLCVPYVLLIGTCFKKELQRFIKDCYNSYDYESLLISKKLSEVTEIRAKNIKKLLKPMAYFCTTILINQNTPAILRAIKTKSVRGLIIFPIWVPYSLDVIPLHIMTIVMQELCLVYRQIAAVGAYLMYFLAHSHIKAETELLTFAIEHIDERAEEMARGYSEYENGKNIRSEKILAHCYNRCMRQCAQHHSGLLNCFNTTAVPFMYVFTLLFVTGSFTCSWATYFLISDNPALRIKYCVMAAYLLLYVYILFLYGEAIKTAFISLPEVIFGIDWLKMPKECRSTIKIMLLQSNRPVYYKLYSGHTVNMETYMVMLKATYYYVNIMMST